MLSAKSPLCIISFNAIIITGGRCCYAQFIHGEMRYQPVGKQWARPGAQICLTWVSAAITWPATAAGPLPAGSSSMAATVAKWSRPASTWTAWPVPGRTCR